MTHTAHVEPGGSAAQMELTAAVTLTKFSVGPMDNNCYLISHRDSGNILIDAAADPSRIAEVVDGRSLDVVITTHQHRDHLGALAEIAQRYTPRLVAGADDRAAIEQHTGVTGIEPVRHGDQLRAGALTVSVIELVGHTPGSIALAFDDQVLFTGDSLFPGGPGKTANADDFTSLMDHLDERVFGAYGDHVVVHPGHGDSTTLGMERPRRAQWRARGW